MKSAQSNLCVECYSEPDERRRRHASKLRYWYALPPGAYDMLLHIQQYRCALCGDAFGVGPKLSPAVDHDHSTGVIRGIIHQECNRGIGHFEDNPVKLERAATYLRTARTVFNARGGKYADGLRKQRQYRRNR